MGFNIDEIEDYIKGKLKAKDLEAFEKRMAEDSAFAKEVDRHERFMAAMGMHTLKENIGAIESELEEEDFFKRKTPARSERTIIRIWSITGVAAAVLVLIVAAFWIFKPSQEERLFSQFFTPYPDQIGEAIELELSETAFVPDADPLNLLKTGMQHYRAARYGPAVKTISQYLSTSAQTHYIYPARFYLALSHLASDRADLAEPLLAELARQADFDRQIDAKWYLLLTYLKLKKTAEAQRLLQELSAEPVYAERIEKIAEILK